MSLSWRVQNIVVIGRIYLKLERSEFSSNFEFDRNMLSGTGAWKEVFEARIFDNYPKSLLRQNINFAPLPKSFFFLFYVHCILIIQFPLPWRSYSLSQSHRHHIWLPVNSAILEGIPGGVSAHEGVFKCIGWSLYNWFCKIIIILA